MKLPHRLQESPFRRAEPALAPPIAAGRGVRTVAFALIFTLVSFPTDAAAPTLPSIAFSLDRTGLDFGTLTVGTTGREGFGITNNSPCPLRLRRVSSGSRAFTSACSGLTNLAEIPAGSVAGCGVEYHPPDPKRHAGSVLVVLGYGYACGHDLHAEMDRVLDFELRGRRDRHDNLVREGPATAEADRRLAQLVTATKDQIEGLEERHKALDVDSPEIAAEFTARKKLIERIHERIGKLQGSWDKLSGDGPDYSALAQLQKARDATYALDRVRLQTERNALEAKVGTLAAEREQALRELREGRFCNGCGMSESEFNRSSKSRVESYAEHVKRNGGLRPATPQETAKKLAEYAKLIADATQLVSAADAKLAKLLADYDKATVDLKGKEVLLKKKHEERLDALDAKIRSVRQELSKRIVDAEARIARLRAAAAEQQSAIDKKIADLERNLVTAKADHKKAVATATAAHKAALRELELQMKRLLSDHEADERTLNRKLKVTRSANVSVVGVGVAR